jgi:hypothetical protein
MWKSYAANNSGVMIQSNYDRLFKSFKKTTKSIQSTLVSYRDFERDHTIPMGNTTYLANHKTKYYSDENELRFIYQVSQERFIHNWDEEESPYGVNVEVDVNVLIEEICLAPFTTQWYLDVVKAVCEKFNIDKPILRSSLEK